MPNHTTNNFFNHFAENFDFDFSQLTWENVVSILAAGGIIFGGVIPYIPQYKEIHQTHNSDGFSIYVCFVLLLANTLRIVFWFGNPFEIALVAQSVIMIITMLALVELYVRTKNRNASRQARHFFDLQIKSFWKWTDFISYLECMATISLIAGVSMYCFINNNYFVQGMGYVALLTESLLGVPQLFKNWRKKSTDGMNKTMVLLWLGGDIFKTAYYLIKKQPVQFITCGAIQITVDILILMQVFFYGPKRYSKIWRR